MKVEINEDFQKAFDVISSTNKNLFISGKAGTGKSTFLEHARIHVKKRFALLAPTGVAALNINGVTIHSFFRLKPSHTIDLVKKTAMKNQNKDIYTRLDSIIIDEVSMVRADIMDFVDIFLRIARGINKPFGGVQMIFIGDVYQLPPIVTPPEREYFRSHYKSPYFFDSLVFHDSSFSMEYIGFKKIYRQKDEYFIQLLNAIRDKTVTFDEIQDLNKRYLPNFTDEESEYITLTTSNKIAQVINENKLKSNKNISYIFDAIVQGDFKPTQFPTDKVLTVKNGAQVMFLNNDSDGKWVNGSIGVITGINEEKALEVLLSNGKKVSVIPHTWEVGKYFFNKETKTLDQEKIGSFTQYPIKLAWAITIHKSQGKTFNKVIIDMGQGAFAHGQSYVALSRCTNLEGIILKKMFRKSDVIMDRRVMEFMGKLAM